MLPDHIVALQTALDNRLAEAMAFGATQTPESTAAWHRVATTQLSLHAALALDMQRRPLPRKVV